MNLDKTFSFANTEDGDRFYNYVRDCNSKLVRHKKQPLSVGLIDALSTDTLYGNAPGIVITEQYPNAVSNPNVKFFTLPTSFYGCYYDPSAAAWDDTNIDKTFNCFINRLDPLRQAWFYEFYNRDWLDHGYVSMNIALRSELGYPSNDPLECWEIFHQKFNSSFDPIKQPVMELLPFKNFSNDQSLYQLIGSSKIGIVIETYPEREDSITFSEKTFRALQSPRPWMMWNATGCIDRLRSFGFNIFDKFVDHSYTNISTQTEAITQMLSIIDQLDSWLNRPVSVAEQQEWKNICNHNRRLLEHWNQTFLKDAFSVVTEAFEYSMESTYCD